MMYKKNKDMYDTHSSQAHQSARNMVSDLVPDGLFPELLRRLRKWGIDPAWS